MKIITIGGQKENHHHRWTEKIVIRGQKCLGDFTKHA